MIGKTLESNPPLSWGAIVWSVIGLTMVATAGFLGNRDWAFAAIAPLLMGLACWMARPQRFRARVTDTGLELESPPGLLGYKDMQMVHVVGANIAQPRVRMFVYHQKGALELPRDLDVPRHDLHGFLVERIEALREPRIIPSLAGFVSDQQAKFGDERVWVYDTRAVIKPPRSWKFFRLVLLALLFAGAIWLTLGAILGDDFWASLGFAFAFISFLVLLVSVLMLLPGFVSRRHDFGSKNWRDSGLVVSPLGIALSQGDVQGQLRWNELRDLKIKKGSFRLSSQSPGPGLLLRVEGADIVIADIYTAPLAKIQQQILAYWREPT